MRRFIIAVFLVLTMDVTRGQIRIQSIPQYPVISGSVTLSVTGITEELEQVSWYKGPSKTPQNHILYYVPGINPTLVWGPLYNDRISPFTNGSLHIRDLRVTDGGKYIAQIQTVTSAKDVDVTLTVYELVTNPRIRASIKQPKENDALTLTCNTLHAMTIRWTRNGTGVPSGFTLSGDNKTLRFSRINRGDAGKYRCEAQNLASTSTSHPYTVTVAYGPDKTQIDQADGAAYVSLGSSITLACSADSVPPPKYQWTHNGTVLAEKTSKYNISNAAHEDEGLYSCAVRNWMTNRTATASVYVSVTAEYIERLEVSRGHLLGLTIGTILVVVLVIIIGVFLYRKILTKKRNESSENRQDRINVYENVTTAQPKEESSYMDLQFRTEDTYAALKT